VIGGPTRLQDFEDVGRLLCEAFDDGGDGSGPESQQSSFGGAIIDNWLWEAGITRTLAAAQYTNRYVSNARKMRGTKYSLLVAKSFGTAANRIAADSDADIAPDENNNNNIKPGQVIAMAEVGVSMYSVLSYSESSDATAPTPVSNRTTDVLASIGVICVQQTQRRSGAASELLKAAESIARTRWNETLLHAAVEQNNAGALSFFRSAGYEDTGLLVEVEVRERMRKGEMRPHILLQKRLR